MRQRVQQVQATAMEGRRLTALVLQSARLRRMSTEQRIDAAQHLRTVLPGAHRRLVELHEEALAKDLDTGQPARLLCQRRDLDAQALFGIFALQIRGARLEAGEP